MLEGSTSNPIDLGERCSAAVVPSQRRVATRLKPVVEVKLGVVLLPAASVSNILQAGF